MRRLLTWGIVTTALVFPLAAGFAADAVVTRRDNFGEDLAFIDRYLSLNWPEYYRAEGLVERGHEFALDDVYVGRYDVNGDGQAELFVHIQFVGLCGSAGCPTHAFERQAGEWAKVSAMSGDPSMDVWVGPDTSYRTVFSYYGGFRWTGEIYEYIGDNEVVAVSALLPPDFEDEGGCIGPRDEGFGYLIEYVGAGSQCVLFTTLM